MVLLLLLCWLLLDGDVVGVVLLLLLCRLLLDGAVVGVVDLDEARANEKVKEMEPELRQNAKYALTIHI